jgi:hypothetical protein
MSRHDKRPRSSASNGQENKAARKTVRRISTRHSGRTFSRAMNILWGDTPIIWVGDHIARVPSETVGGKRYTVNLLRGTCECPWWRKCKESCKHIVAAREARRQTTGQSERGASRTTYKNPRYYDRLRRVRTRCVHELLRCVSNWVSHE